MNSLSQSQSLVVLLLAIVLLSFYGWSQHRQSDKFRNPLQPSTKYVFIQVTGKIKSPGIYSFVQAVTVGQALARAGGTSYPLRQEDESAGAGCQTSNGRRIQIIKEPSGFAGMKIGWMAIPIRLALGVQVDINKASAADLSQVPGINSKLADRIAALRDSKRGFSKLEELCQVKGIGPATVRRLQSYLTVGPGTD